MQFPWQRNSWRKSSWKTWLISLLLSLFLGFATNGLPVAAAGLANSADLTEVQVHLGTTDNQLKFVPDHLEFKAGKRYKLILDNPSGLKHYFTAKDFADGIWTQKVEAGNVEIKGAVHELELKPGAIAEWVFVPLKPGTYSLRCTITGHTEAGMTGTLAIGG